MRQTFLLYGIFLSALATFQSCNNNFVDVTPTESITTEDIENFNNNQGAESFVTSIYSKYLDWNMSSFSWIGITSITSDNADKGANEGGTGTDKHILDALDWTASTPSIQEVWNSRYQAINRANQAIAIIPELDSADSDLRERLIGEAKFLRALTYFTLVRAFGDVPLVDHVPQEGDEEDEKMTLTRAPEEDVYQFIVEDLEDAISVLPDKSKAEVGRATSGAAHALMAKVALYRKDWQKAVDESEKVTGYSLAPDFAKIFRLEGENNEESVFEIQGRGGEGQPGIQQYSQVQAPRGNGGVGGWGFNIPSQNLVDAFEAEGDEVRLKATVIERGETLYDGTVIGFDTDNPYYNYKAYSSNYSADAFSDANLRLIRYAEVLLIKAEALNELGQTSDALKALNEVRERVELPDVTTTDKEELRKAIWKERRLELAMEYDRWWDIIRTGQAEEAMAADGKTFVVGKHELFPLPQQFVDQAKEKGVTIEQNPGY